MVASNWVEACTAELHQAERARAVGNEGMARVCARRAAGIIIREHYRRMGETPPAQSAFTLLNMLSEDPGQTQQVRATAHNFTLVITHDHVLPVAVDLIECAQELAEGLLGEKVSLRD